MKQINKKKSLEYANTWEFKIPGLRYYYWKEEYPSNNPSNNMSSSVYRTDKYAQCICFLFVRLSLKRDI